MRADLDYRHGGVIYGSQPRNDDNPFGTPDWRKAASYPALKDLNDAQWRWEFVRRSSSYREHWSSYQSVLWDGYTCEPETFYWLGQQFKLNYLIDPRIPAAQLEARLLTYSRDFVFWGNMSPDHYDFDTLYDEEGRCLADNDPPAIPYPRESREDFLRETDGLPLFAINPNLPLKPQFSAVARLVSEHQERWRPHLYSALPNSRKIEKNLSIYLRLLDARDVSSPFKSSWQGIQRHIEKEPKRSGIAVRSFHTQALRTQEVMLTKRIVG